MTVPPVKIDVADPQPSRGSMYRYPQKAKDLIVEMLDDMERKGVIEKSTSAWLSPIVLLSKPDGAKGVCLNYRPVNKHLSTDIYPLPRLDELVEQAAGNQYYVTLNLKEAFFKSYWIKRAETSPPSAMESPCTDLEDYPSDYLVPQQFFFFFLAR